MNWHPHTRKDWVLWGLICLASAFILLTYLSPTLTGNDELNGMLGVFLGLFIAAFPAANFLDLLLFEQLARRWRLMKQSEVLWVALNLFVLFTGLVVVVVGTKLFFKHWQA